MDKLFKAKPHSVLEITAGCENKPLTSKQQEELLRLSQKEKLTELQERKLQELKERMKAGKYNLDAPLSVGAKTHAQNWLKVQMYGKKAPQVTSKEVIKGLNVEDESIEYVSKVLGWGDMRKNEKTYENDILIGTPDLVLDNMVVDIKNAYSHMSMPLFDELTKPEYIAQVQAYMALTGKKKAQVIWTLMDVPERDIENAYWAYTKQHPYSLEIGKGSNVMTDDYKEFRKDYLYNDCDDSLRIKTFDIEYDPEYVALIENRVERVREYINSLIT